MFNLFAKATYGFKGLLLIRAYKMVSHTFSYLTVPLTQAGCHAHSAPGSAEEGTAWSVSFVR